MGKIEKLKNSRLAKHPVRRVVGKSEMMSFGGNWLTKRGKRFVGAATVIAGAGMFTGANKIGMAVVPFAAAGATLGVGGAMSYGAKLLDGANRTAAEAKFVGQISNMKRTEEANLEIVLDIWNRVIKYEAGFIYTEKDIGEEKERIARYGVAVEKKLRELDRDCIEFHGDNSKSVSENIASYRRAIERENPMSDGIEPTKEGFIDSAMWTLSNPRMDDEETLRTGVDLSQVGDYQSCEMFTSALRDIYNSNVNLKSIRKKVYPFSPDGLSNIHGAIGAGMLRGLTKNKAYAHAGKWMSAIIKDEGIQKLTAQPFLLMTDSLDSQFRLKHGDDVANLINARRGELYAQVFGDEDSIDKHVYGMFGPDYLRAEKLMLGFNLFYAAGILDQKPADNIGEMEELAGREIMSKEKINQYAERAKRSLDVMNVFGRGYSALEARAMGVAHYASGRVVGTRQYLETAAENAEEYSNDIIQAGIHHLLSIRQIKLHSNLVRSAGRQPLDKLVLEK